MFGGFGGQKLRGGFFFFCNRPSRGICFLYISSCQFNVAAISKNCRRGDSLVFSVWLLTYMGNFWRWFRWWYYFGRYFRVFGLFAHFGCFWSRRTPYHTVNCSRCTIARNVVIKNLMYYIYKKWAIISVFGGRNRINYRIMGGTWWASTPCGVLDSTTAHSSV